jgi:hypothetical protein
MNIFGKKNNQNNLNKSSFSSIQRTMKIEGKMIPAFICNGGSYFYTNLEVYSDGIIDAWGAVDLDFFKRKLASNWVSTSVPNGKEISIHHLGSLKIKNGNWQFDKKSFYDYVLNLIKEMNPKLENLYSFHGTDTIKRGKANYAKLSLLQGKPIKPKDEKYPFLYKITGNNFSAFLKKSDNLYYLCNVSVFTDESIKIDRVPNPINTDLEGLKGMVKDFNLITEVKKGQKVSIYGIGDFEVDNVLYSNKIEALVSEIGDIISELNSKPTTSQTCKNTYDEYIETPTVKLRDELKLAYEKVPEHLRTYILGDMDVKDIPIRMIIYGEEEIKNWSHYLISEQEGYELPQLNVPKPIDEKK